MTNDQPSDHQPAHTVRHLTEKKCLSLFQTHYWPGIWATWPC